MVKVSIVKSPEPNVKEALDLIDFTPKECDLVAIKPDLCVPKPASTGATTDLRILEQVLELYEGLAKERVVMESNHHVSAEESFEKTGAKEVCEAHGASFVNLSKDICIPVRREYNVLRDFRVPRTILKADIFINLPTLKIHELTTVSLSLKNMLGLIPGNKAIYNPRINEAICDVMKIRKPDLNIMDGMIGMEGGGRPVKMDLVAASIDAVALDTICCKLIGVNPDGVEHILRAGYYNLGESTLKRIQVVGQPIESVRKRFVR